MKRSRSAAGFTLVELLVVIGIIALLVSILLPALGKARQQANLVQCASNMRVMGQMMALYESENHGYGPPMVDGIYFYTYADVLSLMNSKPMGTDAPGWATGSGQYMPSQESGIFLDTDLPQFPIDNHATCYNVNPRVFFCSNAASFNLMYDPVQYQSALGDPNKYCFPPVQVGTIKHSADLMVAWCGPVKIGIGSAGSPQIDFGVFQVFSGQLDNYAFYNYHSFLNPPPPKNAAAFLPKDYANAVSLGAPLTGYGSSSSAVFGSVTASYLKAANEDYTADIGNPNTKTSHTYSGPGGSDTCNMRFRHMNNTEANFLFLDGHVEPRVLGTVLAQDVCVRFSN